jgi:hypothetical protein
MIFDIFVTVDDFITLDGVMYFDISKKTHLIDDQLIYMLNQKNINEEIIIEALNEKYYNFEIFYNERGIKTILFPLK